MGFRAGPWGLGSFGWGWVWVWAVTSFAHDTKECYSKKRDTQERSSKTGSSTSQINNTSTPNMNSEKITKYLKENMGIFDEETKLSIVESLIPQDFVQSSN